MFVLSLPLVNNQNTLKWCEDQEAASWSGELLPARTTSDGVSQALWKAPIKNNGSFVKKNKTLNNKNILILVTKRFTNVIKPIKCEI